MLRPVVNRHCDIAESLQTPEFYRRRGRRLHRLPHFFTAGQRRPVMGISALSGLIPVVLYYIQGMDKIRHPDGEKRKSGLRTGDRHMLINNFRDRRISYLRKTTHDRLPQAGDTNGANEVISPSGRLTMYCTAGRKCTADGTYSDVCLGGIHGADGGIQQNYGEQT